MGLIFPSSFPAFMTAILDNNNPAQTYNCQIYPLKLLVIYASFISSKVMPHSRACFAPLFRAFFITYKVTLTHSKSSISRETNWIIFTHKEFVCSHPSHTTAYINSAFIRFTLLPQSALSLPSDQRMSSENSTRRTRRKQSEQPSHNWTPREDVALVEALTEICVGGYWKVDNGFRSGYLGKLEQIIEQKLPNCGLKANPHIESRLKTLKKQTLAIYDMLSNSSGFSWNHEEKMVVCEKQVFDDWVKVHKDAKGLRMKPFIHYDSLIEAFGRDRANGLGAEGPAEADEDINNENNYADMEENGVDEITVPSPITRTPAQPPSARTRKRARDAYSQCLGDMASTLRSFVDVTKAHLETMQGVLMNEHATSERRGKLVDELMKIEGINDYDVIEAAAAIIGDDSKIDLLFSLPDNLKSQWIHKLLGR